MSFTSSFTIRLPARIFLQLGKKMFCVDKYKLISSPDDDENENDNEDDNDESRTDTGNDQGRRRGQGSWKVWKKAD